MIGWVLNLGFAGGEAAVVVSQREPASGGTGSSKWPTRQDYKDKRKRILDDDEDFINLIKLSLPEIIKRLRG